MSIEETQAIVNLQKDMQTVGLNCQSFNASIAALNVSVKKLAASDTTQTTSISALSDDNKALWKAIQTLNATVAMINSAITNLIVTNQKPVATSIVTPTPIIVTPSIPQDSTSNETEKKG
jgi:prefoldin subunit 5